MGERAFLPMFFSKQKIGADKLSSADIFLPDPHPVVRRQIKLLP
jgi:hypothetical protein